MKHPRGGGRPRAIRARLVFSGAVVMALAGSLPVPAAEPGFAELITVDGASPVTGLDPDIAPSGRYVAYVANGSVHIFDRETDQSEPVSVSTTGTPVAASAPSVSANGRFVAFVSSATNLIRGEVDREDPTMPDVFVRDRELDRTIRVTRERDGDFKRVGGDHPDISANGRFVAFTSSSNRLTRNDQFAYDDTFVFDRKTRKHELISARSNGFKANNPSDGETSISARGRFVAFGSHSIVGGSAYDGYRDVFLRDRRLRKTTRLSESPSTGRQGSGPSSSPSISERGKHVVFSSEASNLVMSDDNKARDIFLYSTRSGRLRLLSKRFDGGQTDADSFSPHIAPDGGFVVFESMASNLVDPTVDDGFSDIFMVARTTGGVAMLSRGSCSDKGNGDSVAPTVSRGGRFASFASVASNLVNGDTPDSSDVFVRDTSIGCG